jgi:hypothetical protein
MQVRRFGGGLREGGIGPVGFFDGVFGLESGRWEGGERVADGGVREAAERGGVVFDRVFADLVERGFAGGGEGGDLVCYGGVATLPSGGCK